MSSSSTDEVDEIVDQVVENYIDSMVDGEANKPTSQRDELISKEIGN